MEGYISKDPLIKRMYSELDDFVKTSLLLESIICIYGVIYKYGEIGSEYHFHVDLDERPDGKSPAVGLWCDAVWMLPSLPNEYFEVREKIGKIFQVTGYGRRDIYDHVEVGFFQRKNSKEELADALGKVFNELDQKPFFMTRTLTIDYTPKL